MANLGSFSAAMREHSPDTSERDTFDFYGETFTVHGEIPAMVELTISAALAGKVSSIDGDAAMFEALRHSLTAPTPDDDRSDTTQWDRFYRLAVSKRAPEDLLTSLVLNLVAAQLGKARERLSTSSPGEPPTSTSSKSSSSDSPASGLRPVDEVLAGLPISPAAS